MLCHDATNHRSFVTSCVLELLVPCCIFASMFCRIQHLVGCVSQLVWVLACNGVRSRYADTDRYLRRHLGVCMGYL